MRLLLTSPLIAMTAVSSVQGRIQRMRSGGLSKDVLRTIQSHNENQVKRESNFDIWAERELQMSMSMSMNTCPFTEDERQIAIIDQIIPITDSTLLVTPGTPQFDAITWLLDEDEYFICPSEEPCPEKAINRFLMALLYFSTEGDGWTNCASAGSGSPCDTSLCNLGSERWLSSSDECDWCGLSCSNAKDLGPPVTGCGTTDIDIESINQAGVLPFELGAASELRQIRMQNGKIDGTMPEEWGVLSELRVFDLNDQQLDGPIPDTYYDLAKLNILDLDTNTLTGSVSERIGELTRLRFFEVGNNNMGGPFPQAIGTLEDLVVLGMSDNEFTGELPDTWVTNKLDTLFLENNKLSGDLEFLGDLPEYETLFIMDFSNNEFTGTIPTAMENAVNMFRLNFSFNDLEGEMPPEMKFIDFDQLSADCVNPVKVVCLFCTQCTSNP